MKSLPLAKSLFCQRGQTVDRRSKIEQNLIQWSKSLFKLPWENLIQWFNSLVDRFTFYKMSTLLIDTSFIQKIYLKYVLQVEFVTGGVELLKGHCTDIPADQGPWKRICAICSFWRLFTIIMTKSVEVFQFSFWKTKLLIFFFYFIKIKPPA